ncbi:MAG: ABC transporter ATP-binding protein [Desulfarculaceae bacterium]|jgi:putative ABC transport system ATP-binding protein
MNTPDKEFIFHAEELCKDYQVGPQTVHALSQVKLLVEPGEFLAVMGPSGSGKSTLMNLLGCLDTPTSGRLMLEGTEVSLMTSRERARVRNLRLGFVFQSFNLLPRTSALQNVAVPLRYGGVPLHSRIERATKVLEKVGLADRADHHPSQLSGGQQQRVAIARALVNQPSVILADEPTGALDTRTGLEIMSLFQEVNQQGITIVLVTHEEEIAKFARRLIRFRDGRLVEDSVRSDSPHAAGTLAEAAKDQDGA